MLKLDATASRLREERYAPLLSKLVLHRGWHSLSLNDGRPLENTREAYRLATQLNPGFAECDCWDTKDGEIVLCHNSSFKSLAEFDTSISAVTPISEQTWDEVKNIRLKDGSTPVLLSTVLRDLKGTNTRLAIELKSFRPAKPLAAFLNNNPDIVDSVGFVMSFSSAAVEAFQTSINPTFGIQVNWLVNSSASYPPEVLDEGETTFLAESIDLVSFLKEKGKYDMMINCKPGLYLQYNNRLTPIILSRIRKDLANLEGLDEKNVFLGIWSDRALTPGFDTASSLSEWVGLLNAINTDLPDSFFEDETSNQ